MKLFSIVLIMNLLSAPQSLAFESEIGDSEEKAFFKIGEKDLVFPIPSGYCLPQGNNKKWVKELSLIDDTNFTHIFVGKCEQWVGREKAGGIKNYGAVKSPQKAKNKNWEMDRKGFLSKIFKTMSGAQGEQLINQANNDIKKRMEEFEISVGKINDLGVIYKDEDALYKGSTYPVSVGSAKVDLAEVAAMTLIKGKLVFYYLSDHYETRETIPSLLEKAKLHVHSFVKANE